MQLDAPFPAPLQCLFEPKRFKVLYGGRGAGRSWGVARALLLLGISKRIRVLCARELQNSIDESVHKVLSDQIENLDIGQHYTIQRDRIIGKNGSSFVFAGIKNNVNKIRSYEGMDYCWVEEANKVSRNSWGVLLPTIRRPDSEIWITFNPELDTDYTFQRFVKDPKLRLAPKDRFASPTDCPIFESDDAFVVKMTYANNPWFPKVLRKDMESDRAREGHYDYYLNVWEGHTLQMLEGAVFARELRKAQEENRITDVPYYAEVPVDTYWDLGRADQTAIWFGQQVGMQHRVLDYMAETGGDIQHFIKQLQRKQYTYGTMHLPHDGKAKWVGTKMSVEEVLKYAGFKTHIVERQSKIDQIGAARMFMGRCYFDETKCEEGINALRHYRYKVIEGQMSTDPVHDWASDGADAFSTMALATALPRGPQRTADRLESLKKRVSEIAAGAASGLGWMG